MWKFTKRFGSGWVGFTLALVTIAGGLSVTVWDVTWGYLVLAALLVAVFASYQLFDEQEKRIARLESEQWTLRNGTNLLVKVPWDAVEDESQWGYRVLLLEEVYLVNRSRDQSADLWFTLVSGTGSARATGPPSDSESSLQRYEITSPLHMNPQSHREGTIKFTAIGNPDELSSFDGQLRLEIRDEQTDFMAEIDIPTDDRGVMLIQRREGS